MIRSYITGILFLLASTVCTGQKVKYKDLFVLLNASQFDTAEPPLKRYLKETDDNPNAYYFMGVIFQEKLVKIDPLVNTDLYTVTTDSALLYFDIAYKGIDEREIKRNDEYYESFSRRDIRTGKFEVKLSDIRLQLEDRMKSLRERKDRVKQLKSNFVSSEAAYKRAQAMFKKMLTDYSSDREFYLRADDKLMAGLKALELVYDSAIQSFNQYKSISHLMGKTGHSQLLDPQEIRDMKRDGSSSIDFLQENLKIWDYKSWAVKASETISQEIIPLRTQLISVDIEINKLREQQRKDSVSVIDQLGKLNDKQIFEQLRKFDPNPLPITVFGMNIADLEYTSDLILHKKLKDSANVKLKLECVRKELESISKMDSLAKNLAARDFNRESLLYSDFITKAYGTAAVLKSNAKASQDYAAREKLKRDREWERISQSLKWAVSGSDSIPLFVEAGHEFKLKPIVIVPENHTAGLKYLDTLAVGYFYTITPSRIPDVKVTFPVDNKHFKRRNLPLIKGLSFSEPKGQLFFALMYSEAKDEEKFPATLVKIYRTDGMAWSSNLSLDMIPSELHYSSETGELSIKITSPSGDSRMVVVDKNGKLL